MCLCGTRDGIAILHKANHRIPFKGSKMQSGITKLGNINRRVGTYKQNACRRMEHCNTVCHFRLVGHSVELSVDDGGAAAKAEKFSF
jgi:hypothetical protein